MADGIGPVLKAKGLVSPGLVKYHAEPPELVSELRETSVHSSDFAPAPTKRKRPKNGPPLPPQPYLLIGFDTEFKTPDRALTAAEVHQGDAKYRVLSYQFHAKTSDGREWQGLCCPQRDERMSLGEFVVFALGLGAREHGYKDLPTSIYLVGHFTRADIPAFRDFRDLQAFLSNVRNTFISTEFHTPLEIQAVDGAPKVSLKIHFRDTMLLTPQASKSLKALGELVGQPKLTLDPDPVKHKEMIRNMDRVRVENWEVFKSYALNDATICVRYAERLIAQYEEVTGKTKLPVTLTSIGIDLLKKSWIDAGMSPLSIVGREAVTEKYFVKSLGRYVTTRREVPLPEVYFSQALVTETYHGGRNEQFWFGPAFADEWTDFDLSSAYPTAMALIGMPAWTKMEYCKDISQFTPTTLGFAFVDFEFPPDTQYPTLPVRTSHGLIFPLKGKSYCAAPEIFLAKQLGARLNIEKGLIVPTDPSTKVFGDFIKDCLKRREEAGSKTLTGLFWKEISNSTYGKTAQGLREKRVYDMRDKATRLLPESPISNPYFASYITSFTRAVLGEVLNGLPQTTCVFSCTTDGFLSNATESEIKIAQQGPLASIFRQSRESLTGKPSVLEKKHVIKKPLGWRTRGQASLIPGDDPEKGDDFNVLLAKGGIFVAPELETIGDQNAEIIDMFLKRTPDSKVVVESMTGVRDMVEHNADLVEKVFSKTLSMEYDWKRQPRSIAMSKTHSHILFSTRPWKTEAQFTELRDAWDAYTAKAHACIKTVEDFNVFASRVETSSLLSSANKRYLNKKSRVLPLSHGHFREGSS